MRRDRKKPTKTEALEERWKPTPGAIPGWESEARRFKFDPTAGLAEEAHIRAICEEKWREPRPTEEHVAAVIQERGFFALDAPSVRQRIQDLRYIATFPYEVIAANSPGRGGVPSVADRELARQRLDEVAAAIKGALRAPFLTGGGRHYRWAVIKAIEIRAKEIQREPHDGKKRLTLDTARGLAIEQLRARMGSSANEIGGLTSFGAYTGQKRRLRRELRDRFAEQLQKKTRHR